MLCFLNLKLICLLLILDSWSAFCLLKYYTEYIFRLASSVCSCFTNLLGVRWELRGREHLEQDRACIIVANHQSSLDVMGMFQIWPIMDKCTVVGKKELFYVWPFGLAAWLCGLIFIDRMNSEKARHCINTATNHIKDKKVIFIFYFLFYIFIVMTSKYFFTIYIHFYVFFLD